ncbi:hypothetical protein PTKIN_Ptkin17bG0113100 [Pterospermum kingtungense]
MCTILAMIRYKDASYMRVIGELLVPLSSGIMCMAKVGKEVVQAIDSEKNAITFRVIEGDLKEYKSFVVHIQASPNPKSEGGSIVHWTLEYERLHDAIAHPETLLQFVFDISKDIDAHLTQGN